MNAPSVGQQLSDRTAQREQLAAFFRLHPDTIFSQETLAEACGADIGAVRSRISELRSHKYGALPLRSTWVQKKKRWEFVSRPDRPLGRDAGEFVAFKDPVTRGFSNEFRLT